MSTDQYIIFGKLKKRLQDVCVYRQIDENKKNK